MKRNTHQESMFFNSLQLFLTRFNFNNDVKKSPLQASTSQKLILDLNVFSSPMTSQILVVKPNFLRVEDSSFRIQRKQQKVTTQKNYGKKITIQLSLYFTFYIKMSDCITFNYSLHWPGNLILYLDANEALWSFYAHQFPLKPSLKATLNFKEVFVTSTPDFYSLQ